MRVTVYRLAPVPVGAAFPVVVGVWANNVDGVVWHHHGCPVVERADEDDLVERRRLSLALTSGERQAPCVEGGRC